MSATINGMFCSVPRSPDLQQASRALLGAALAFRQEEQPIEARRVLLASLDVSWRRRCVNEFATYDLPEATATAVDYARRLYDISAIGRREFDQLVDRYDHRGPVDWEALEALFELAREARGECQGKPEYHSAENSQTKPRRSIDEIPATARFVRNNYDGTATVNVTGLFEVQIRPGNEPLAQLLDEQEAESVADEYNRATPDGIRRAVAVPMDDLAERCKGHKGKPPVVTEGGRA